MTEEKGFQYSILRYTHDQETGEFLNVGLALFSPEAGTFKSRILQKYSRLTGAFPGTDGAEYRNYVRRLQTSLDVVASEMGSSQLGFLESRPDGIEPLLRKVLAVDDAAIQFSEPRGGIAEDLDSVFETLFSRLVERYLAEPEVESRNDEEVWETYKKELEARDVIPRLRPYRFKTELDTFQFDHAWKNGNWNALQPLSFDLVWPKNIKNKAKQWLGNSVLLRDRSHLGGLYFLLGGPSSLEDDVELAYEQAKQILVESGDGFVRIVEERDAETFAKDLESQIH